MKKHHILILLCAFVFIMSCDKLLLDEENPANPVSTFDYLWHDMDRNYGLFIVKNINWDSLYQVYRPMITVNSTDEELYKVTTSMLRHLNDGHVVLYPTGSELKPYNSGETEKYLKRKDFKYQVVEDNYLTENKVYSEIIKYGLLPNNIGYVYINGMDNSQRHYRKAFDEIMDYLKDTKSIIIDIRNNGGGWDRTTETIGGRFFSQKTLFLIVKKRNGSNHNDFCEPINYYIQPYGDFQYLKPVVLLTNRVTASAAESFILGMKQRSDIVQIGDTTEGVFSDAPTRELINGWFYSLSIGDYRDCDNTSWEGIGCLPDIVVQNDSVNIENGEDKVLETAISYINKL